MRRCIAVSLASFLVLAAAPMAHAVDCSIGKGKTVTLDWKERPDTSAPIPFLGLRTVAEKCRTDSTTIYLLDGMPGEYKSAENALRAFKYIQAASRIFPNDDSLMAALAYVRKIETEADGEPGKGTALIEQDESKLWMDSMRQSMAAPVDKPN